MAEMDYWFSDMHTGNVKIVSGSANSYILELVSFSVLMFLIHLSLESFLLQMVILYSLKKMSSHMMR